MHAGSYCEVQQLRLTRIPIPKQALLAQGLLLSRLRALAGNAFDQALIAFRLAHRLVPDHLIYRDRAKLLEAAIAERKVVRWRGSLINLQRKLGILCTKTCCACVSHAQVARCRSLIASGLRHERDGITIYTLAPYYSRWSGDRWTRLLKAVKSSFRPTCSNQLQTSSRFPLRIQI